MHTMVTDGSSRLKPGMELVLTRWIALSGTAKLAEEKEAELLKRFPETLVREARHFSELENTEETLKLAKRWEQIRRPARMRMNITPWGRAAS